MTSISDWLGNTTSYSYDADDNQTTVTYPTSTKDVDHLVYDDAGRAVSQTLKHDGSIRATLAYDFNDADQLTSQIETGDLTGGHGYDYDPQGRLSADGPESFDYDSAGNLTGLRDATLSYDAADRLTSSTTAGDTTTFNSDVVGNRTTTTPPTGPSTDYGYDQADQLASVDDDTGSPIGYTYAADGLRASKTKSSQTTRFTWDRSSSLAVLLAKDSTRYVHDVDGLPLEQVESDGTVSYLHHDRLGSTRLVTNADGSTQATYAYDAYGNRTTTGSSSVPFGYTGQYTDTDTGLIYLRARYYDPATGQFLTRDPLEASTGDAYRYASNDPVNAADPSGLCSVLPWSGNSCFSKPAADALDGLTAGLSTLIAAKLVGFDAGCSGIGDGAVAQLAGLIGFGKAKLGGKLAAKGAERTLGPRFAPGRWLPHFEKHASEFGYKNSVEYLKGARDLVGREGVETFTRTNGDRLFYDAARNEFAAMKPDGVLRTYFRPKNGSSFWQGQTGG